MAHKVNDNNNDKDNDNNDNDNDHYNDNDMMMIRTMIMIMVMITAKILKMTIDTTTSAATYNILFNFKNMYVIYRKMFEVRIKHYIKIRIIFILKKITTVSIYNDFPNTFLAALMRSRTLAGSPEI